jgi:hypothetical protein
MYRARSKQPAKRRRPSGPSCFHSSAAAAHNGRHTADSLSAVGNNWFAQSRARDNTCARPSRSPRCSLRCAQAVRRLPPRRVRAGVPVRLRGRRREPGACQARAACAAPLACHCRREPPRAAPARCWCRLQLRRYSHARRARVLHGASAHAVRRGEARRGECSVLTRSAAGAQVRSSRSW